MRLARAALILLLATHALAQTTAIRAARMLDVRAGTIVRDAVVVVKGGRITAIGGAIPNDATVIDLGDVTLLPGLVDAHTHLLLKFDPKLTDDINLLSNVHLGTARRALMGAQYAREVLEAGFTTVRDLGNSGVNGDVALRDAIRSGWVAGPRIYAATRALSPVGGQFGPMSRETQGVIDQEYAIVTGADDARRAVRQAVYDGADCIKVIVNPSLAMFSADELKAIVAEAHAAERKVAAHATSDAAARLAAEAGVDSIEHGYELSDETIRIMAEKKVFLVPTDYPADMYVRLGTVDERNAEGLVASQRDRLARARKAGVRVVAGSDEYYAFPGETRGQSAARIFRAYAASGMQPIDVIRAATSDAAELLAGTNARFGTLAVGKQADIIAVAGDPLADTGALEQVRFVMRGGKVIRNETTPQRHAATE